MPENTSIPKSILLADDDADDRMLFEEALKEVDNDTRLLIANDGQQLMEMLEKKQPNELIVFLDLNMPRKNGFECLQEIRRKEKFKDIPVVVYSTSCQQDAIHKMYEYGANYYICKPNSFKNLKSALQHLFAIDLKTFHRPSLKDFVISF